MEWSEEDVDAAQSAAEAVTCEEIPPEIAADARTMFRAVMTCAVELMAARGHPHQERLRQIALDFEMGNKALYTEVIENMEVMLAIIAAQGARIAVLEAEFAREKDWRTKAEDLANSHADSLNNIRRRSLEAANLERLIAEKGIPATMRWVMDGDVHPLTLVDTERDEAATSLQRIRSRAASDEAIEDPEAFRAWAAKRIDYPCSPTCTHDDAATPGHPERVKERSDAFMHPNGRCTRAGEGTCAWCDRAARGQDYDRGADAMRAACIAEARAFWEEEGVSQVLVLRMIGRLEGATP